MKLLIFSLLLACVSHASTLKEKGEIPPRTYVEELAKEADAALRVRVKSIYLDSCKTCTSTGKLYVIEAVIIKKYFDKGKHIKGKRIYYTSGADAVSTRSKDIIVFLNRTERQDIGKYRSVAWAARQSTEFIYAPETASFISGPDQR